MQPIPTNLGWTTRRPNSTGAAPSPNSNFNTQLQGVLQQSRPAQIDGGPSRATTGHFHPGGMNDAALRLLRLGGKG